MASEQETTFCDKANCINLGTKKCIRCKVPLNCSKECQTSEWKSHNIKCKLIAKETPKPAKQQASAGKDETHNFFKIVIMKMKGESNSLADDYLQYYPKENQHARFISYAESIYFNHMLKDQSGLKQLQDEDFTSPQNFLLRWKKLLLIDQKHLMRFIEARPTFGEIYIKPTHLPYQSPFFQTMRNTSIADQVYEFGNTYVGFGYVDLGQILWGNLKYSDSRRLTFYGYDMNRVVVLRSKLIYIIFKYYQESEINTRNALQIWFSSCWDDLTLKSFQKVLQDILNDPEKYDIIEEELPLIKKWKKNKISVSNAQDEFCRVKEYFQFDDVVRMTTIEDRVLFARYIFTGCIFVDVDFTVCGNPTMFTLYDDKTKHPLESFFKTIDLRADYFICGKIRSNSLFDTICSTTINKTVRFRALVSAEKIVCHLETKMVDPLDLKFAAEIKALNPYGIDWSNTPDYMEKKAFINFAKACSVEETLHHLHFLNWTQYVYGSCHVDWMDQQEKCNKLYEEFLSRFNSARRSQKHLEGKYSMMNFFDGFPFINSLNGVNMMLTSMFRNKFEDFFLSDKNGKVLNRHRTETCDSMESSFFDQSPTMFRSVFSFNDGIILDDPNRKIMLCFRNKRDFLDTIEDI